MLTECQDVAVLPHRDGEANGRAAVVSEYRLLRVSIASLHLGMSLSRKNRPLKRKLMAFRLSSDVN